MGRSNLAILPPCFACVVLRKPNRARAFRILQSEGDVPGSMLIVKGVETLCGLC